MPRGVPLSSDVIPPGTGLVQSVECCGANIKKLELPVVAQINTFANGIRRVCCPHGRKLISRSNAGELHCQTGTIKGGGLEKCIYAWEDPSAA